MYPKISFITVVRNNAQALHTTLSNISSLPYSNKEIIVIDGASTDSTVTVAAQFAHQITYFISEPDQGIYFAMNKALRVATGQYVWFVNAADRVVNFDALYRLLVNDTPLADIYYGDTQIVDLDGRVLGLRKKCPPAQLTCRSLRQGMVVSHQSFIVRRSIAPFYDTEFRYSADVDWMYLCLAAADSAVNVGAILSQFELGGATTTHHKESLIERWRIMCRRFGVVRTTISHLGFIFDAIFRPPYR